MADYDVELECGCITWCRCEHLKAKQIAHGHGFDLQTLKISQYIYICHICDAITLDYQKHKDWHEDLVT